MKMLVLGAGLQGSACAYDLLQQSDVTEVRLADKSVEHLPDFLRPFVGGRLQPISLDVTDRAATLRAMHGVRGVMCAVPYYFDLPMAEAAIEAGAHFCDLGGNTDIVFQQKTLDDRAKGAGVTVIPDCGLAPGMVNILAQLGISRCDTVGSVKIFVGGLPQTPEPPLNYQVVYSLEGVLDYYTTLSWVIRDGKRHQVKALSEREPVVFDGIGELEAFHTAGGLSTLGFRYEGKIPTMEYKTLRYPGHAHIMEAIRDLGLLDLEPVEVNGTRIAPRDVTIAAMGPKLRKPGHRDLVALRVVVTGVRSGKPAKHVFELIDRHDEQTGITAMMRTTGYSLAITGLLQARGQVEPAGVRTPDECMPGELYVAELAKRGIRIVESRVDRRHAS